MKKMLTVYIIMILTGFAAQAQLYIKNSLKTPIMIATVTYRASKSFTGWTSDGWYRIEPGETKAVRGHLGDSRYLYYYATSTTSNKEYGGDKKFLVANGSFRIQNADMEYVKNEHPEYYFKNFRKIHATDSKLQTRFTVDVSY